MIPYINKPLILGYALSNRRLLGSVGVSEVSSLGGPPLMVGESELYSSI